MKTKLLLVFMSLMLLSGAVSGQVCEVFIDNVTNVVNDTDLVAGSSHVVTLGVRSYCSATGTYNATNGIIVYSPDGATFEGFTGHVLQTWTDMNWTQVYENHFLGNSSGGACQSGDWTCWSAATAPVSSGGTDVAVSFAGISFSPTAGLPTDYDDTTWAIEFTSDGSDAGLHVCLDSTFTPPGGAWKWVSVGAGQPDIYADWAGPFCYKVLDISDVNSSGDGRIPDKFELEQNYPNPFNPTTTISFDVPIRSHVQLKVFNLLGQKVATLVDETLAPGFAYEARWNGTSDGGNEVASGMYFYRLTADGNTIKTKKMMLLK